MSSPSFRSIRQILFLRLFLAVLLLSVVVGGAVFLVEARLISNQGEMLGNLTRVFAPDRDAERMHTALWATVLAATFALISAFVIYLIFRSLIVRLGSQAEELLLANVDMIKVVGSLIAKRDSETDAHNFRVTIYSVRLAEAMGLDPEDIRSLIKGAFLHDVGKIGIPDAILHKPSRLNEAESKVMQNHVRYGLDIVGNAHWLADAACIVGCHHEKFDGSGYPNRFTGEEIPLTARIFAVVDVFDALTSVRPYKKAFSITVSLAILRQGSGNHFDPELIAVFEPLAPALLAGVAVPPEELPQLLEIATMPYFGIGWKATSL